MLKHIFHHIIDEYYFVIRRIEKMSITWDEIKIKYSKDRNQMSEDREREFINDCFDCYEQEGFAKRFQSPFGDYKDRIGQTFKVINRCSEKDSDLSSLPMWNIQFKDGLIIGAYPEEIILSEMKRNGYDPELYN